MWTHIPKIPAPQYLGSLDCRRLSWAGWDWTVCWPLPLPQRRVGNGGKRRIPPWTGEKAQCTSHRRHGRRKLGANWSFGVHCACKDEQRRVAIGGERRRRHRQTSAGGRGEEADVERREYGKQQVSIGGYLGEMNGRFIVRFSLRMVL